MDILIVGTQTSTKQIPTSTHNRFYLLSNRRRRKVPCQARQEDEEEQRFDRCDSLWRPRIRPDQEA